MSQLWSGEGKANDPVGSADGTLGVTTAFDAEWLFSAPQGNSRCGELADGPISFSRLLFSMDAGASFFDPSPVDATFDADHKYEYTVTGTGQKAAFKIK